MLRTALLRPTLLVLAGLLTLAAVQAGEYPTTQLWRDAKRLAVLRASTDSLREASDSLADAIVAVRRDPVTQERVARELFGMVRGDREVLIRVLTSDTPPRTP